MIGGPLSGSSEVHVMNRFQIIAGRWLAFIIAGRLLGLRGAAVFLTKEPQ